MDDDDGDDDDDDDDDGCIHSILRLLSIQIQSLSLANRCSALLYHIYDMDMTK